MTHKDGEREIGIGTLLLGRGGVMQIGGQSDDSRDSLLVAQSYFQCHYAALGETGKDDALGTNALIDLGLNEGLDRQR